MNSAMPQLDALVAEMDAKTKDACAVEPDELYRLRMGQLPNRAGSYGQYFSTWVVAHGMLRDYAMYTLYPLILLARNSEFTGEQIKTMLKTFDPPYTHYLRYSGFETLHKFSSTFLELLDIATSKDQILSMLMSLTRYVNQLSAWSHHYFPWMAGSNYAYKDHSTDGAPTSPSSPTISTVIEGFRIQLSWEPLGIKVSAVLANAENPELCEEFKQALPFRALQDHAVVTGQSMYAWAPMISVAPIRVVERISDAPIGRLRFSQLTGNKLIVQYGETSEDLCVPVLGSVVGEDLDAIREVGRYVWKSTFQSKELIWLSVSAG
jgi:hypothetical protein